MIVDCPPPLVLAKPAIIRPAEHSLFRPGAFRPCSVAERRAILAELVRSGRLTKADAARAMLLVPVIGWNATFAGYSTEYTTPGTQTISIPAGASTVTVECIAGGASGSRNGGPGGNAPGGGGGEYAQKTTYSVAGLTGIYISVPASVAGVSSSATAGNAGSDCFAKENSSGGTDICRAKGAPATATPGFGAKTGAGGSGGTGDILRSGGSTSEDRFAPNVAGAGAGAGGTTGAGGSVTNSNTGGTSGGSPAGAGGNSPGTGAGDGTAGSNYGGGGGASVSGTSGAGAQGWLKLTWA